MNITSLSAGDPRVDAFHRGIYWDAFAAQHEPVAAWHAALAGGPYGFTLDLALDGDAIAGGITYERYPTSGCGLVTYMVIAPAYRRAGLGQQLLRRAVDALHARGAPLVFGEVNDPRLAMHDPAADAWSRLERFQRWGARVLDVRYIQPALGAGLARDRQLVLIALAGNAPLPDSISGATVRTFLDEFYSITEGAPPDTDIVIPDMVRLIHLEPSRS